MTERAKRIAAECREAADIYDRSPGFAGLGANAGTIADLYRTIARLADLLNKDGPLNPKEG